MFIFNSSVLICFFFISKYSKLVINNKASIKECHFNENRISFKCYICSLIINSSRRVAKKKENGKKIIFSSIVFINLIKDNRIYSFVFLINRYIFRKVCKKSFNALINKLFQSIINQNLVQCFHASILRDNIDRHHQNELHIHCQYPKRLRLDLHHHLMIYE